MKIVNILKERPEAITVGLVSVVDDVVQRCRRAGVRAYSRGDGVMEVADKTAFIRYLDKTLVELTNKEAADNE